MNPMPRRARPTKSPTGPHFINVDLEVWSRTDLAPLAAALQGRALILYAGRSRRKFLVAIEAQSGRLTSPEGTIRTLLRVIKALPRPAARAWKGADARIFNVGFEGGEVVTVHERPAGSGRWFPRRGGDAALLCEASLSPDLLRAIVQVGGTITTTIYAPTKFARPRRA